MPVSLERRLALIADLGARRLRAQAAAAQASADLAAVLRVTNAEHPNVPQQELARRAGVSRPAVKGWLREPTPVAEDLAAAQRLHQELAR